MTGKIRSIVYQPPDRSYDEHIGDFIREPLQQATLVANHGIEGDHKAGRNPQRQLNMLSHAWLERLRLLGYRTEPGDFGEQIVLQGVPLDQLKRGDRLRFGAEAVVEITMPRTGCIRLEAAQGKKNDAFDGLVGLMAKVVEGGVIRVGDSVALDSSHG